MTRAAQEKVYADFSGGYLTEGNILSYPENAASEMVNFDLKENGSISRRLGMNFEANTSIDIPTNPTARPAINTFKWEAVNGDPEVNIAVVQAGNRLDFWYLRQDGITDQVKAADSITLDRAVGSSVATDALVFSTDVRIASGAGRLFIVGKYIDPLYLTFNAPAIQYSQGSVTSTNIEINIRDFTIWKEGEYNGSTSLAGEIRQDTMSAYHQYNLYNQGWPGLQDKTTGARSEYEDKAWVSRDTTPDDGVYFREPATYCELRTGFFPTTADQIFAYQAGSGSRTVEVIAFNPFAMLNDYVGNTKAGRGHSILPAFARKREGAGSDGVYKTETEQTGYRPEATAFYAGRVWYAGTQGEGFSSEIYFSQVLDNDLKRAGKCYQEADPTAEVINELIATDGGVLSIDEMGKVYKMTQFGSSLIVIASNGVWSISGDGEISSFTATSFSINKVSDKETISFRSIVEAKDALFYMGVTAIYQVTPDPATGRLVATDISSTKIKSFYQGLSNTQKALVFSVYDEGDDKVYWHYPSTPAVEQDDTTPTLDRGLVLDLTLGAYGKYSLSLDLGNPDYRIQPRAALPVDVSTVVTTVEEVISNGEPVEINGEPVVVTITESIPDRSSVKYLIVEEVLGSLRYIFADYRDKEFADFGVSFDSFLETGFDALADILRKSKKAPVAVFNFERTEKGFEVDPDDPDGLELLLTDPSGCLISYKWDWGEKPYGNQFQGYRLLKNYIPSGPTDTFDYDRAVATSRNRLRGRGTSLGFRIDSEAGKDMKMLGYGIMFTKRTRV